MLITLARSHLPNYHTQLNIAGHLITNSLVLEGSEGPYLTKFPSK
jgi:hypothetical protein